jgi:hypothetical protein
LYKQTQPQTGVLPKLQIAGLYKGAFILRALRAADLREMAVVTAVEESV